MRRLRYSTVTVCIGLPLSLQRNSRELRAAAAATKRPACMPRVSGAARHPAAASRSWAVTQPHVTQAHRSSAPRRWANEASPCPECSTRSAITPFSSLRQREGACTWGRLGDVGAGQRQPPQRQCRHPALPCTCIHRTAALPHLPSTRGSRSHAPGQLLRGLLVQLQLLLGLPDQVGLILALHPSALHLQCKHQCGSSGGSSSGRRQSGSIPGSVHAPPAAKGSVGQEARGSKQACQAEAPSKAHREDGLPGLHGHHAYVLHRTTCAPGAWGVVG